MRSQTINISLPADLLGQLDKAAKAAFRSRSGFIQDAVITKLQLAKLRQEEEDWLALEQSAAELEEVAKRRGYTTDEDFVRLVKEVRAERRTKQQRSA